VLPGLSPSATSVLAAGNRVAGSIVLHAFVRRAPVDAKPTRSQTFLVDETEKHETIAKVVDRLSNGTATLSPGHGGNA
jgi:hypothetical protein